jgi:hypothetical protein
MWAKIVFKHPSVRRFRTALSLIGVPLRQELNGRQQKTVTGMGCEANEYTLLVREMENGEFTDDLQISASEQVHLGINCFAVECSGSRKLAPGVLDDAEYLYTPDQCE